MHWRGASLITIYSGWRKEGEPKRPGLLHQDDVVLLLLIHRFHLQLDRLADTVGEWERKAEFAISRGREDLAKGALLEKSKVADAAKALEDELSLLDESLAKNDQDVARLESKLTEAKAKQKTIRSRKETVDSRLKVRRQLHDPRVDDAFARFEKIEKRIDATEGEIESYDLGKRKSLSDEIAELEAESSIEKELEALKARVGNTPKS